MTKRIVIVIITHAWLLSALAFTQKTSALTPTLVVQQFYELLHQKRYAEGFRLSVYRTAIEGLTADEMQELEPDFERLAASLPPHIETRGEQVSGDTATVFIKLPNEAQAQPVALMKLEGQWIIGDRETQRVIKRHGRNYFFNERIRISENEVKEWLQEILGGELIYQKAKQSYTSLEELIKLGGVSQQLTSGQASGYRFALQVSADRKSFVVTAIPAQYGRTGKLSFYADQTNLIRAEDHGGKPATSSSPAYESE